MWEKSEFIRQLESCPEVKGEAMTQHELLEEGIDLERGAKRIAEINAARSNTTTPILTQCPHLWKIVNEVVVCDLCGVTQKARKQRSDAGAIYITPAKGVRLDISEPTGKSYLCDIMGRYAKAEYAEELASIGAQLLAIIERRK